MTDSKGNKQQKEESTVAGYKPEEVVKAPAEPPEPVDKSPPNTHQRKVIYFGLALIVASILIWPIFNFFVAVGVALAGGAAIAFGSLIRV